MAGVDIAKGLRSHPLDYHVVSSMRSVLEDPRFEQYKRMRDETVVALASLGRRTADIRRMWLSVKTVGVRNELCSLGLAATDDPDSLRWDLTVAGIAVADALAARLPDPTAEQEAEAGERTRELVSSWTAQRGISE